MINIIGNFFGVDGYSNHTKGLANALNKVTDVRVSTRLMPGWESVVTDEELRMIKRPVTEDEINLMITMPHQWKSFTKAGRNWGYCIWEGDRVPKSWIEEFENPDIEYIIVASKHTKQAIEKVTKDKKILNKIKIIPHGVDMDIFYPVTVVKEYFTFLCNKGWRNEHDRGGIQYVIRAYMEEFSNKDNTELVIKINPAYPMGNLDALFKKYEKKDNTPKIRVVVQLLNPKQMNELYNICDVFVSATRAEAYNLPCIEAMACGKPVITTNFGGQVDYVNKKNGWIIGGKLEEVQHELPYEGIKWLSPDIMELRKAMRDAYKNQKVERKRVNAFKSVKDNTWLNSAKLMKELI